MNLNTIMFWRKPASAQAQENSDAPVESNSNVVHAAFGARTAESGSNEVAVPVLADGPRRFKGLLEAPEVSAFFALPHFGRGRAVGASTRSLESVELGEAELVADFQNVLRLLVQRRDAKRQCLHLELAKVEGVSPAIAAELKLACKHLDDEVESLEQQIALAAESKGWVLEALNSFRAGVHRGVRDAVEFLLLSA